MKLKTLTLSLLIACGSAFSQESSASRNETLRQLFTTCYLAESCEPFLNILAAQAATSLGSDKTVDMDKLIEQLRKQFQEEAFIEELGAPYSNFSDEEIVQLREIYEMPVYAKFNQEGAHIFQSNMQTIQSSLTKLANLYAVEKEADQAVASNVIEITEENFTQEIEQSDVPVIIDFYGNACPPCRLMEPIFEDLSLQYQGKVRFARICCDTQFELMRRYEIASMPTLLFINAGETTPAIKTAGFMNKKKLEAKISEFLSKSEIAQGQ